MGKKVIIIGAGIAGLTAGIYLRRSGIDVTLIEQHSIVGGVCTSWKRKGYFFEGALHWMTGSKKELAIHQLWKDTGALTENIRIFHGDPFMSIEWEGEIINLYRDFNKTIEHLIKISPNDEKALRSLYKDIKKLSKMEMPNTDIKGLKSENPQKMSLGFLFRILPSLPVVNRLSKMSCKDYTEKFEHPGIRRLFSSLLPDGYAANSLVFTLATLDSGDGGYPEGGSLAMAQRMGKKFTDLGGELLLNTKVEKVIIENGIATGVRLKGKTLTAGAVIVTQEAVAALDQLFDIPLNEVWLNELRKVPPITCTFIGLGIKALIPNTPGWKLTEPINFAGEKINELAFYNYSDFKKYAPDGCTTLTTVFMGDTYDFWLKAKNEGRYEAEKEALADQVIGAISAKFPQTKDNFEVVDVATPLTYERYTGAYHGAWMSVVRAGDKMTMNTGEVKSVKGLYFSGHRMYMPGGQPAAAASGRTAAQLVCRQFDMVFR